MECYVYNSCNHKDCDKFCLRKYKLDNLYNNSLLSDAQRVKQALFLDSDNTDKKEFSELHEIEETIDSFVKTGKNLYIHSTQCGNGKTSWAIRLIQSYFNKIWPKSTVGCHALFISVPRFLSALKDNITVKNEYVAFIKENIINADLVVFDDIAAKNGSTFDLDNLLSIIDTRIAMGKSNIYTSNLSPSGIYEALGERLASRICNYSVDIEFRGADKRKFGIKNGGIN